MELESRCQVFSFSIVCHLLLHLMICFEILWKLHSMETSVHAKLMKCSLHLLTLEL